MEDRGKSNSTDGVLVLIISITEDFSNFCNVKIHKGVVSHISIQAFFSCCLYIVFHNKALYKSVFHYKVTNEGLFRYITALNRHCHVCLGSGYKAFNNGVKGYKKAEAEERERGQNIFDIKVKDEDNCTFFDSHSIVIFFYEAEGGYEKVNKRAVF